jgi:hypothetical protein
MDLEGAYDSLREVRGNLSKLGPTEKAKAADTLKRVDSLLAGLGKVLATKKALDKRLADIKKLSADIGVYNLALDKITAEARVLTRPAADLAKSDTPKRDFFRMANYLQRVGQETHLEAP